MSIRRLLVLSCSRAKNVVDEPTEAWDLYDGMAFRVAKKAFRDNNVYNVTLIRIISAKHGLIGPTRVISEYDEIMTERRARSLRRGLIDDLREIVAEVRVQQVFLYGGKRYRAAVSPYNDWVKDAKLFAPTGGIGRKLSQLKEWLASPDVSSEAL